MNTPLTFNLKGWCQPQPVKWEENGAFCFSSHIDILSESNRYINKQGDLSETPSRLVDSYRSYLIQSLKDIDYLVEGIKCGSSILADRTNYALDMAICKAHPWRFTSYATFFIAGKLESAGIGACQLSTPETAWRIIKPLLDDAFNNGSIFKIEKYIKVAHVLMDISYDIGWGEVCGNVSNLKKPEGLTSNPTRVATLREISLYVARNFNLRGYSDDAQYILYIGFPDMANVISSLDIDDLDTLLQDDNRHRSIQFLSDKQLNLPCEKIDYNQVVAGALRLIRGGNKG